MNNRPVTLVQIARELSISPGALSNWQKRYDDFPAPAGFDGRRRFFLISDVQEFMKRHDLKAGSFNVEVDRGSNQETKLISLTMAVLREHVQAGNEIILAISALAARSVSQVQTHEDQLIRDGRSTDGKHLEADIAAGMEIFDRLMILDRETIISEWSNVAIELDRQILASSIRQLLRDLSGRKVGGEFTTPQSVASLMSRIASALDVLDLCSGYGTLLHEYRKGSRRRVGQEINPGVASISRLLAYIEGYEVEIYTEDSLSVCHEEWLSDGFFGVVADPPIGLRLDEHLMNPNDLRWTLMAQSKRHQTEDFWIQSALSYLKPSSDGINHRAVLMLRSGWFSDSAESPMRDALLKFGLIEAVVTLGGGSSAAAGVSMNLLVLRKGVVGTTTVRMIDAQQAGRSVRGVREYSRQEIDVIVNAINGRVTGDSGGTIKVLDVSVTKILENDSVLDVRRYLAEIEEQLTVEDGLKNTNLAVQEFKKSIEELRAVVNALQPTDLIKKFSQDSGVVRLVPVGGSQSDNAPFVSQFKHRPKDRAWTRDDIVDGDIVVCLVGSQAGEVLLGDEFRDGDIRWAKVWILRAVPRTLNPRYLATWARFGGLDLQIRPLVSGTTLPTLSKRDVDRVVVPIPTLEAQESIAQWGDLVRALTTVLGATTNSQNRLVESIHSLTGAFFKEVGRQGLEGPR